MDELLKWIGVLGLRTVSLGWQIWTFHYQNQPLLRGAANLSVDADGPTIQAKVWNAGRVPIYLTDVELAFPDADPEEPPELPRCKSP